MVVEDHRRHYDRERPHGGIGYRIPKQAFMEACLSTLKRPTLLAHHLIHSRKPLPVRRDQISHSFWNKAKTPSFHVRLNNHAIHSLVAWCSKRVRKQFAFVSHGQGAPFNGVTYQCRRSGNLQFLFQVCAVGFHRFDADMQFGGNLQ